MKAVGAHDDWHFPCLQVKSCTAQSTTNKLPLISQNIDNDVTRYGIQNVRTHLIECPRDVEQRQREELWNFQQKFRGATILKFQKESSDVTSDVISDLGTNIGLSDVSLASTSLKSIKEGRASCPGDGDTRALTSQTRTIVSGSSSLPSMFKKRLKQRNVRLASLRYESGRRVVSMANMIDQQRQQSSRNDHQYHHQQQAPKIERLYSSGLIVKNSLYNQLRQADDTRPDGQNRSGGPGSRISESFQKFGQSLEKLPDIKYPGAKSVQPSQQVRFYKTAGSHSNDTGLNQCLDRKNASLRHSLSNSNCVGSPQLKQSHFEQPKYASCDTIKHERTISSLNEIAKVSKSEYKATGDVAHVVYSSRRSSDKEMYQSSCVDTTPEKGNKQTREGSEKTITGNVKNHQQQENKTHHGNTHVSQHNNRHSEHTRSVYAQDKHLSEHVKIDDNATIEPEGNDMRLTDGVNADLDKAFKTDRKLFADNLCECGSEEKCNTVLATHGTETCGNGNVKRNESTSKCYRNDTNDACDFSGGNQQRKVSRERLDIGTLSYTHSKTKTVAEVNQNGPENNVKEEKEDSVDAIETESESNSDESVYIPDSSRRGHTTHSVDKKLSIRSPWQWKPSPYRWVDKGYIQESDKPYIERVINSGDIIDEFEYDYFARTRPLKVHKFPEGAGYRDRNGVLR